MWLPESAEEIERLATDGSIEETHHFDVKELLGRNKDVAVDVCAMTPDGGTLLYGVGEDDDGRPTRPAPFELAGHRERIDQVVATSILEPPTIVVTERPLAADPSRGYLVVNVPQSPRAPHQVVVGGDLRYYGRGATGNRILPEPEVADLYARRERWEVDRDALLDDVVSTPPIPRSADVAFLHAFVRPVVPDETMLRTAIGDDEMVVRNALRAATASVHTRARGRRPALRDQGPWTLHGTSGIFVGDTTARGNAIQMRVDHDGRGLLFATAGTQHEGAGRIQLHVDQIAQNLGSCLAGMGAFFEVVGYAGPVDVGVALTHVLGAVNSSHPDDGHGLPEQEYRQTARVLATDLRERPAAVAEQLLRRFLDAMVAFDYSPWVAREHG